MALQTIKEINVDFYDKKYILINAKQFDKNSRYILVTCYNHGVIYPINSGEHSAYIRYKKSDNYSVFNFCEIDRKGKIKVELTEQMLAASGICYADLVIVNKGDANINIDNGDIINIDNASILSTMTFCIDVSETAADNSNIESTYEFNAFNKAIEKVEQERTKESGKMMGVVHLRMFINTINKAVDVVQKAGVMVETSKKENKNFIEYIIKIPCDKDKLKIMQIE